MKNNKTEETEFKPRFLENVNNKKSFLPQHLNEEDKNQRIHSSTNTLYVSSMLVAPNKDELLLCVAKAIKLQIREPDEDSNLMDESCPQIFDEYEYPLGEWKENEDGTVSVQQIYNFITQIFKATKMKTECAVMTLAYIERILLNKKVKIELTSNTWRRILLSAMIVSDKVFEDYAVWNVDFMNMVPMSSVDDLNKLERKFLTYLQFKTSLSATDYARYYFALRELATNKNNFSEKALTEKEAKKLETMTSTFQQNQLDAHEKFKLQKKDNKESRMVHSFNDFEELKAQIIEDQKKKNSSNNLQKPKKEEKK
eukprot:TRINITY_DN5004_c0_g1_i1.p1 TRINITY_DN5004_c0_g1~~TRINITY_DN5004_c0_g1_i1.p1  ORF type:complete len:312 (-),score=104.26 TRINITY_DN5004_c0_g1_i1:30-965(-)